MSVRGHCTPPSKTEHCLMTTLEVVVNDLFCFKLINYSIATESVFVFSFFFVDIKKLATSHFRCSRNISRLRYGISEFTALISYYYTGWVKNGPILALIT